MSQVHVRVVGFDHLVLRCADVEASLAWYCGVLNLSPVRVEEWRSGKAPFPSVRVSAATIIDLIPGTVSDDRARHNVDHLCLVADRATVDAIAGAPDDFRIIDGPEPRFGARGEGWSIYVLDPDDNVVEIRSY